MKLEKSGSKLDPAPFFEYQMDTFCRLWRTGHVLLCLENCSFADYFFRIWSIWWVWVIPGGRKIFLGTFCGLNRVMTVKDVAKNWQGRFFWKTYQILPNFLLKVNLYDMQCLELWLFVFKNDILKICLWYFFLISVEPSLQDN